ncbi:MAG: multiple resistance and pH regulation protein F, partial [Candidatus Krumholzibacteria bacterium]|nr:multiple resistance and pH regulation protein F [Candidatus Krumholzibacteria bacterium]
MSVFIALLIFCSFLCLYRVGKGPTAPDRTVAIDILGTIIVGFCCVYTMCFGAGYYLNIGIAWALVSFIGT